MRTASSSCYFKAFRELFMGDAGEASEDRLLAADAPSHPEDDIHADVLKVGHHGSRYASTASFIAAVQPKLAVISVGRHNTFGHPAPSTLNTLEAEGSAAFRTDQCGAITLNGQQQAKTMLPCEVR
jgi:competence protein ComEC